MFLLDLEQLLYSGDRNELLDAHDRDYGKEIFNKFESQLANQVGRDGSGCF